MSLKKKRQDDFQEIRAILKEATTNQRETDRLLKEQAEEKKEIDRLLKEHAKELKEQAKEKKEIDRLLKEHSKELKEQARQADKRIKELDELFTGQWGKLMEALVEGDLIRLLRERKIDVERTVTRAQGVFRGEKQEMDILAFNGSEMVVTEVKTTLRVKDVHHFLERLKNFEDFFPEYKGKAIYGAIAYLKSNEHSSQFAEKQGLFVIRATGSSASLVNAKNFKPKRF